MALDQPSEKRRKYRAFLSYSHVDLEFARRLQSWLEAFELAGGGKPLRPVYRDESAITAGSLPDGLKGALSDSDALVVIASTASAESRWVMQEIAHFRSARPDGKCLAIFAPESRSDTPLPPGFQDVDDESFIPNPAADGELLAFLRLAAGLLSVSLDEAQQFHSRRTRRVREEFESESKFQIEQHIKYLNPKNDTYEGDQSAYWVRQLCSTVVEWAVSDGRSEYEFQKTLGESLEVLDGVARSLSGDDKNRDFWTIPITGRLRSWKAPQMSRQDFDSAVTSYLKLPIRHPRFDRLLVEASILMEYFHLRDLLDNPKAVVQFYRNLDEGERERFSSMIRSPWRATFGPVVGRMAFYAAAYFALSYSHALGWLGDTAREVVLFIGAAIVALDVIITLLSLPAELRLNSMVPAKLKDALREIQAITDFMGEGEISVAELNRKARMAETNGARWPITLMPLLDDIERRSTIL